MIGAHRSRPVRAQQRVGERNGLLVVIGADARVDGSKLQVKCDCGTVKWIRAGNFKRTRSCGCLPVGGAAHRPEPIIQAGKRFGRLVILEKLPKSKARYLCDCGTIRITSQNNISSGSTRSCGCYESASNHPLRSIWDGMIRRCENPNERAFPSYGARGIKVCSRWRNDFWAFVADMGERPSPDHTLDRIDMDGDYEPGNCRWATWDFQRRHKRGYRHVMVDGQELTLPQLAQRVGIAVDRIYRMVKHASPQEVADQLVASHPRSA